MKTRIELSEDDVKQILSEYIGDKYPQFNVNRVIPNIENRMEGYGMSERSVNKFCGFYINCETK